VALKAASQSPGVGQLWLAQPENLLAHFERGRRGIGGRTGAGYHPPGFLTDLSNVMLRI
jgi:hypothetical protein